MHDDVYQMYLEELKAIPACTPEEEAKLLARVGHGDGEAKKRLLEGSLGRVLELARPYEGKGLSLGDLVQEANIALVMAVDGYESGDSVTYFHATVEKRVKEALEAALETQKLESQVEEEMLARVNVLQTVSQKLAGELGREATVAELAAKMKMSEDEIKDIMKLTLDAMSVSPDAEV